MPTLKTAKNNSLDKYCVFSSKLIYKNIKLSSFKSIENIQKKDDGPDSTVSNNQFSSVTLNKLAMNARKRAYYNFEFQRGSQSKFAILLARKNIQYESFKWQSNRFH